MGMDNVYMTRQLFYYAIFFILLKERDATPLDDLHPVVVWIVRER